MNSDPTATFRLSFRKVAPRLLGVVLGISLVLDTLFYLAVRSTHPSAWHWQGFWEALTLAIVVQAVCMFAVLAAIPFVKVEIGPEGVRGSDWKGARRNITWDAVSSASRTNWLGLRALRVHSLDGETPLSLPLYVRNLDDLVACVHSVAPEDNAVRKAFRESVGPPAR